MSDGRVILPFASRQDLLDELTEIRAARDAIVGEICPERARELRENLAWWERELLEQLETLSEPEQTEESELTMRQSARDAADGGTDSDVAEPPSRSGSLSASRGAL